MIGGWGIKSIGVKTVRRGVRENNHKSGGTSLNGVLFVDRKEALIETNIW